MLNKTQVIPFIPTKSVAYMSWSWLLGNVYTAKSCKGKRRDPDAPGTSQLRDTTLTENIGPPGQPGVGHRADDPSLEKTLVMKSEEAIKSSDKGQGPHKAVEPMIMIKNQERVSLIFFKQVS
jgi:hypothetical protein